MLKLSSGDLVILKLILNYYEEIILAEEKEVVNKIVIICMNPKLVPKAMDDRLSLQSASSSQSSASPVILKKYSDAEKLAITGKLKELSQQENWKAYPQNGLTMLLTMDDLPLAVKITKELEKTGAVKVKLQRNTQTQQSVVRVEEVNLSKLEKIKEFDLPKVEAKQESAFHLTPLA